MSPLRGIKVWVTSSSRGVPGEGAGLMVKGEGVQLGHELRGCWRGLAGMTGGALPVPLLLATWQHLGERRLACRAW